MFLYLTGIGQVA